MSILNPTLADQRRLELGSSFHLTGLQTNILDFVLQIERDGNEDFNIRLENSITYCD